MLKRRASVSWALALALLASCQMFRPKSNGQTYGFSTFGGPTGSASSAAQIDFYVAPTGNDSAAGTLGAPWATVQHAVDQIVSKGLNQNMKRDLVVHLSGDLQRTAVTITNAINPTNGFSVRFVSSPGDARLIGGYKLDTSTCAIFSGSIWRCPVASTDDIRTMYENHVRGTLARAPNVGANVNFPDQASPIFLSQDVGSATHTVFGYLSSDVNLAGVPATDVSVVTQSGGPNEWFWDIDPATAINTSTHQITLAHELRYYSYVAGATCGGGPCPGSRYYLQGALAFLDAAGEWYLDRAAHQLYYWPRAGTMVGQEILIPTTKDVIRVVGASEGALARNIVFDGIAVEGSDFTDWFRYGVWGSQPPYPPPTPAGPDWDPTAGAGHAWPTFSITETIAQNRHGAIYLQNTDSITITNSHLSNTGFSAVYGYLYNQHGTFTNNWIEKTGYGGIQLEGGYPAEGDRNNHHTISGNLFERPGQLIHHGRCVDFLSVSDSKISHNECGRGPREGILIVGNCSASDPALCYSKNNVVDHDWVHDVMQDSSDGGAFYTSALLLYTARPTASVNFYRQLLVDHTYPNPTIRFGPGVAYYFDEGAEGQDVANADGTNNSNGIISHVNGTSTWNVSWIGGFSSSGLSYEGIGVDYSAFPYLAASTRAFSDDFESGLGSWTTGIGSPAITTAQAHSGTHAWNATDGTVIYRALDGVQRRKVSIWMYDSGSATTEVFAHVDEGTFSAGVFTAYNTSFSVWRALGIDTTTSTGFYCAMYNNATNITTVARTVGWHRLQWDYESNDHVDMSIDGVVVGRPTGVRQFNVIAMGDFVLDGRSGAAYFDDVQITY
jgi:hypothetical protein